MQTELIEITKNISLGENESALSLWEKNKDSFTLNQIETLAINAYQKKMYVLSENIAKNAIQRGSSNALVFYLIGFIQGSRYEYIEAKSNLSKAYVLNPENHYISSAYALVLRYLFLV